MKNKINFRLGYVFTDVRVDGFVSHKRRAYIMRYGSDFWNGKTIARIELPYYYTL